MKHKLFWGSSYDRGLDVLLYIWPDIIAKYPDTTLDICYGWDLFDKANANNPERMQWKANVSALINQEGITHHGRIGKQQLAEIRKQCTIWAYPTYFTEINCITALECQKDGLVPVTMTLAALSETAKNGILIDGDINKPEVLEEYKTKLLELMGDDKEWKRISQKCQKFARKYDWSTIADKWISAFNEPNKTMRVTVYTPTVRDGWWNIMAHNLSQQTHKDFEWIIVDDSKQNRAETAKKYAQKYNLDIKYMKGKPRKVKRTYSLCNANNTAVEAATGELFVFLQDFVLIQPTALEELVRESLRHPGDFIAPCDVYYQSKIQPDQDNKEDWFNGKLDIIGDFIRANVRIQNKGLRRTKTLTDFEQNFGAVPTKTLRELGGYWEFFDEALSWDDTEIIFRAFKLGYKLWIDESNIAVCIDHHQVLGKDEGGTSVNRARRSNDPRFYWLSKKIDSGEIPVVRTQEIDDSIDLQYEVPDSISDEKISDWIINNKAEIAGSWK